MPTNHDETLHERYAREHEDTLARLGRMTPEKIHNMQLELHNALRDVDRLHAELAALKAGQDEAVAWEYRMFHGDDTVTPGWDRWERVEARYASETVASRVKEIQGYIDQGYRYELRVLYTAPPSTADARLVPVELLEQWADKLDGSDSAGYGWEDNLAEQIRALLAQSESKEVKS